MCFDNSGYLCKLLLRSWLQRVRTAVKHNVRHVHNKSSGSILRLEHRIQLERELFTKLLLFMFSSSGELTRPVGFRLSVLLFYSSTLRVLSGELGLSLGLNAIPFR